MSTTALFDSRLMISVHKESMRDTYASVTLYADRPLFECNDVFPVFVNGVNFFPLIVLSCSRLNSERILSMAGGRYGWRQGVDDF